MARKRKTLPKDFEEQLKTASLDELIALLAPCQVDARGGYNKATALAFPECPHELALYLLEQGADIEAPDRYGYTPLQERASRYNGNIRSLLELGADPHANTGKGTALHFAVKNHRAEHVEILLEYGARVDALANYGYGDARGQYSPLELTLLSCQNAHIEDALKITKTLLAAGAEKTERMKDFVRAIGESFEYYRPHFRDESVEQTSQALHELYRLFEVEPVPPRVLHDGKTAIEVKSKTWQKQHAELWELLVPSRSYAQTLQGEVIRISGKIAREIKDNAARNWDEDYKNMLDAFCVFVQKGQALSEELQEELSSIAKEIKRTKEEHIYRFCELAVLWVLQNPQPLALERPGYAR